MTRDLASGIVNFLFTDVEAPSDAVFSELFRVLAPGGRMQIADVSPEPGHR